MKEYRFTAAEIKDLVRKMIILVDSREKRNQHILAYFEKQGIPYQVTKLDFGDYSFLLPASAAGIDLYFHQDICIERKATLEELSGNLAQKRQLFETEFLKAGNNGAKVYWWNIRAAIRTLSIMHIRPNFPRLLLWHH